MRLRGRCKFLCTASAMFFLLGVVRGIGGVIDLINNTDILIEVDSSSITLVLLTLSYIILSAAAFITAIALYEQNENYISGGIILSAIFAVNGILQGYIFFDQTINGAVIINTLAAVIIILLLTRAKKSFYKKEQTESLEILNSNPEESLSH